MLLTTGIAWLLSLSACTETKTKNVPQPVPPTPPTPAVNEEARDYDKYTELVWSDEFNTGALDQTKWTYELGAGGWGDNELQRYTNANDNSYRSECNVCIHAKQSGPNS